MALSSYMQNRLIEMFFTGGGSNVSPMKDKQPYLALYTAGGGLDDTYVEVPTGASGYSRVLASLAIETSAQINNLTYVTNPATINFPISTTSWGTIQYLGLTNEATSGSLIFVTPLTAPTTVDSGKIFRLNPHNLYFSLENHQWTGYWETVKPGGWSVDYSLQTIKWIMNVNMLPAATFPYTSFYSVRLGRNVQYDLINRFVSWTECSGGGYYPITMDGTGLYGGPDWSKGYYNGQAFNNKELSWGPATSDWGSITDVLLISANDNIPAFWAHLGGTGVTVSTGEGFTILEELLYTRFDTTA